MYLKQSIVSNLTFIILFYIDVTEQLESYRLPKTIKPKHYHLKILTHLEEGNYSFEGNVSIKIIITENTNEIKLNAKNLKIASSHVWVKNITDKNQEKLTILNILLIPLNDFLIIKLQDVLIAGQRYLIKIPFSAALREGLKGYYRSSYVDRDTDRVKWLAITQFQSIFAREAFPCFDEPSMKAKFTISLGHKKYLKAISNMPLVKTTAMEGKTDWVWDEFQKSVPMSTYLVAFMISEMEYKDADKSDGNVKFRIWARKDAIEQVEFVKKLGPKILSFYEKYFGIKFPLPKQDLVALPDFFHGAMENWGLVTFRESDLLCNKNSSTATKESISLTLAHELAHQWFGNLVTMKWWSDLWLNEGFATYMEAVTVNSIFPKWNTLNSSSVYSMISVMEIDGLESTHEVSVEIHESKDIEQVFDDISYEKGAILIRMMQMLLGKDIFQNGIQNYLKTYSYKNAETSDLWKALTNSSLEAGVLEKSLTIDSIMNCWALQSGFPVVHVVRNYKKNSAVITQKRYFTLKPQHKSDKNKSDSCWMIPLTYTTSTELNFIETKVKKWLYCGQLQIDDIAFENDWIIFNINFQALYKVNYDKENWIKLSKTLNSPQFKIISTLNRVQLIQDVMGFAWKGDLEYTLAFNLLHYLHQEDEFLPWSVGLNEVGKISAVIKRLPMFGHFKRYVKKLIRPVFKKYNNISKIPKSYEEHKLKLLITSKACDYNIKACSQEAVKLFKKWSMEPRPEKSKMIHEDLKIIVYCEGIKHGTEKEWNFLFSVYNKTNFAKEKLIILSALSCSQEVWILNRYLYMLLDRNSGIRQQDSNHVFQNIVYSSIGYFVAKEFFYNNIEEIITIFKNAPETLLGNFAISLIDSMTSDKAVNEMKALLKQYKEVFSPSGMTIKQSLDAVLVNINWLKKNYLIENIIRHA